MRLFQKIFQHCDDVNNASFYIVIVIKADNNLSPSKKLSSLILESLEKNVQR